MRQTMPTIEGCKANDDMHHLRLLSMLQELVRDKGVMEATRVLDINYKTLTSSMKTGHLSKRTRWALERTLLNGEGCAAPGQRERNVQLGKQLYKLEEELRSGLEELRTALDSSLTELRATLDGQREEHTSHRRRVERQLAALVLGHAATARKTPGSDEIGTDDSGASVTRSGPPWWRPGEAAEREVADLIYEWRQARNSLIAAEERLGIALDWDMVPDFAMRDDMAEASAERRTARSRQLSKRKVARSQQVEHDISEPG